MWFTIAKKEFKAAGRSKVLYLLAGIVWVLLLIAATAGIQRYNEVATKKEAAAKMFRHEWEEQEANPHSAAHFGTYLYKPNTFLTVYDQGLNNYTGVSYRVEAHVQHEVNYSIAQDTDSQIHFGELSVSLVFQLLLPLLIVFLCYSSVTREQEGNTLPMMLVQGASPKTILAGKIMGNYAIVLLIAIPAMVLMALPVLLQHDGPSLMGRYFLFAGGYLLYFFIVTAFAVIVSAWSKSSGASLLISLGLWVLLFVLLPRYEVRSINASNPLPSRFDLNRKMQLAYSNGLNDDGNSTQRYEAYLKKTLQQYGKDTVTALPVNFDGLSMQNGEDYEAKIYEKYGGEVAEVIRNQQKQLELFSLLNPFLAIKQASMGLSGADYFHHLHFHEQARIYRNEFVRTLNMDMANSGSAYLTYDYKVGPAFFKKMNDFSYQMPLTKQAVAWHRWSWISLLLWFALSLVMIPLCAKQMNP